MCHVFCVGLATALVCHDIDQMAALHTVNFDIINL